MTWTLPNQFDIPILGQTNGSVSSLTGIFELVRVEQDEATMEVSTLLAKLPQAKLRPLDASERVAHSGWEWLDMDMDGKLRGLGQGAQEADIGNFGVPLASDEDPNPLRDMGRSSAHPIFGTAPNAPLRYLR